MQFAEAGVELGGGEAAHAVEIAQVIRGGMFALAEVAFHTGGHQVAVGIFSGESARHDVVEALQLGGRAAQAVKAGTAFAIVNGFAERPGFEEINGLEVSDRRFFGSGRCAVIGRAERGDFFGTAHLDNVAGFAAFEQTQSAEFIEAAHGLAHGSVGKTEFVGDVQNRKVQAGLADDERMAKQVGIDGAVPDAEAEARRENIFKLNPEMLGVEFFVWHGFAF